MACSLYELYYFMNANREQTERSMIIVSSSSAIMSLIGLIAALRLDTQDHGLSLIPTYTFAFDDLSTPQPLMKGLSTVET